MARNLFTQAVEEVRASRRSVLDLTVSNPTRVGLRYDSAAVLGALRSERALDYDPQAKGLLAARQAVMQAAFSPAVGSDGKPMPYTIVYKYDFDLDNE